MKMFRVVVNGSEYKVEIEELAGESTAQPTPPKPAPAKAAKPAPQPKATPKAQPAQPAPEGGTVVALMPGTVLIVTVDVGETVTNGQIRSIPPIRS